MSKRVRKGNSLRYFRRNSYNFGGAFKKSLGNFSLDDLGSSLGSSVGAIGSAAGGMVGGLISNGLESKAGTVLNSIGDMASAIPGPWGAAIGAGAKILGGAVNATVGMKVDQEKLNAANQGTSYLNNFVSNASTFDEIEGPQAQSAVGNVYKGGLVSKRKARDKNRKLQEERLVAKNFADRSVQTNIENIANDQMNNMLTDYAAYGGRLFKDGGGSTLGKLGRGWYDNTIGAAIDLGRALFSNRGGAFGGGTFSGAGSGSDFGVEDNYSPRENSFKGIVWPYVKDTFEDAYGRARKAGLKTFEFDGKTYSTDYDTSGDQEKARRNNEAARKRVIYGLAGASKWKHAFGGLMDSPGLLGGVFLPSSGAIDYEVTQRRLAQRDLALKKALGGALHTHGSDWTNGVTMINNGGSHESNPLEGVPMGMAADGQPNLVEEGEVIYKGYVFSNRIKVPKTIREKYKLKGSSGMTFADAAKKVQKESEERPNDPISKRGLEDIMMKLMVEQENIRRRREAKQAKYAYGGLMGHHFSGPGADSQILKDPFYYLPEGQIQQKPLSAQEFWAQQHPGIAYPTPVSTPAPTYGTIRTTQTKDGITEYADEPIINGYTTLETQRKANAVKAAQSAAQSAADTKQGILSGLRFVPAVGNAISVFSDLMGWTNNADYSNANSIIDIANSIGDVRYSPIGDYQRPEVFDRLFYANQLGNQAGATRRSILNTSGGSRGAAMSGLLAADYNAQNQLGNLYRQAEEFNAGQREKAATFNRATNMFNAENDLKAQIASRENARIRVDAAAKAAALRDAIDGRIGAAKSANLTNLFDSLGDIGREAFAMDMIRNNPGLLYDWMGRYKNRLLADADGTNTSGSKKAKGGYLTIKKRGRK
jgi:hypothetical protein